MPDILLNRETVILTAPSDALFPRNDLYPADDLYPYGEVREVTNIVAGSLKLDSLLAEKSIQFGQFYATKFEVQVYNEEDLSGRYIHVYQREGNVYHDLFTGVIDSCKVDKIGTDRTIVAYDKAYVTRQMNVADFWNSYWTIEGQTATLKQVRDALLGYYGIPHEDVTLPNDNLVVSKNVDFTSCSLQQLLGSICELNCCLPHFNGNGYLEFIMLDTEATPVDISGKYEWMNSDFQDYVTAPISGIQFFDSDDQLKYTYGSADNAYPIKKNVFLYNADDTTLNSVASTMMNYLQDIVYTPASLKMIVGSFDLDLGDYVHTEKGNFYILQNSYSGSQFVEQTIKAEGDEQSYGGTEDLDYGEIILNQKYARVSKDLENFIAEYGKEQTATTTKIDGIFANYTSDDAVDYAPSVSSPPASTWVNPDTRKNHLGELFYDTVNKKYYEWQKTSDTPTYNWIQVPSYAHNYSMVSSRFQLNENAITSEVTRATTEEKGIKQDNAEAFANYIGTYVPTSSNVPASSWTTDTLKKAHAGEVFYNKTTEKYYVYTLTYNADGSINTAGWVQQNINKRYDLVTTTSNSKMEQTSTSFSVAINTEKQERQEENALSFANYSGNGAPTQSWSGDARLLHSGDVYYDKTNKKYYVYTITFNQDGSIDTAKWEPTTINSKYDLVSETSFSKMQLADNNFSVALNAEKEERHSENAESFATYISATSDTTDYAAIMASKSYNWNTDALKKQHAGEIYYNRTTQHYWQWTVNVDSVTDGVTSATWNDITDDLGGKKYNLVTSTIESKLGLTTTEFSVELSSEETARKNGDIAGTYNYSGTGGKSGAASVSGSNTWDDDEKKAHAGDIFYDTDTKHYWYYKVTLDSSTGAISSAKWEDLGRKTNTYDLVTKTSDSKMKLNASEFSVSLNSEIKSRQQADLESTYNYSGTGAPTDSWSASEKKNHVGEIYYRTDNQTYYVYEKTDTDTYAWVPKNITRPFDLTTQSNSATLKLAEDEFSTQISQSESRTSTKIAESFANYKGNYTPTISNAPASSWSSSSYTRHLGEIFYRSDTQQYYRWSVSGNGYAWLPVTAYSTYDLVTSGIYQTATEIRLEVAKSESELFANYKDSGYPSINPWSDDDKNHVGEVYYDTTNNVYYKFVTTKHKNNGALKIVLNSNSQTEATHDFITFCFEDEGESGGISFLEYITGAHLSGNIGGTTLYYPYTNSEKRLYFYTDNSVVKRGYKIDSIERVDEEGVTYSSYTTESDWPTPSSGSYSKVQGYRFKTPDFDDATKTYSNNLRVYDKYSESEIADRRTKTEYYTYGWEVVDTSTSSFATISSQIRQTTEEIQLKVSNDDVVSAINLSTDAIELTTTGRLLITAGNFQLDELGNVTANGATLTGGSLEVTKQGEEITIIDLETGDSVTYDTSVHFKVSENGITWDTEYSSMTEDGIFTSGQDSGKQLQINDGRIIFLRNQDIYGNIYSGKTATNESGLCINGDVIQISCNKFGITNEDDPSIKAVFNQNGNFQIYNTASGHRSLTTSRGITVQSDGIEATGDSWFKNELKARTLKVTDGTSVVWSGNTLTGWSGHFQTKSGNTVYVRYGIITSVEDDNIIIES